ncbi:MAG: endonuclease III domain-containing protein [Candidatus Bathyarchaeia archaeon]
MEDAERMDEILERLERTFPVGWSPRRRDAFTTLIAVILSQNTTSKASTEAFERLQQRFDIRPEVLASVDPEEIKPLIRSAGLHEMKSRRIVYVSKTVMERFGGGLDHVMKLPFHEARAALMGMEGIGPKTADVVLAFASGREILPIDTNIFRVANRIGLVRGRDYEKTRTTLEGLIPPDKRLDAHLLLIRLGREFCRARNPRCGVCPINNLCDKNI